MIVKRTILMNALETAAHQYEDDARVHGDPLQTPGYGTAEGRARIVKQFERMAGEARALASLLAQLDRIELED